ncbi:MAG: hypothetical protein FH748_07980 [Balneolaceae bacterium]|nr:hypothetical protein [Balneolaceae bacterium]
MNSIKLLSRSEMKNIKAGSNSCEESYDICQCSALTACYAQLCTANPFADGTKVAECVMQARTAMKYTCPGIEASPMCVNYD